MVSVVIDPVRRWKESAEGPPKGTVCENCKKHEAAENFLIEGGWLDIVHGNWQYWCKCCVLKAQVKHCKDAVKRLPGLEKSLAQVNCEPIPAGSRRRSVKKVAVRR
jgi:hypothetical protein